MYTSRELERRPKSKPQTRSKMIDRVSTCRGLRRNSSSRANSVRVSSISVAVSSHLARSRIELEVGEAQHVASSRSAVRRSSARSRARSSASAKGFGEVVVRAGVQAGDPAVDLGARGEHEHRNRVSGAPQAPADLEPVDARHEHVEDRRRRAGRRLESRERLARRPRRARPRTPRARARAAAIRALRARRRRRRSSCCSCSA